MPNWVKHNVEVYGTKEQLKKFKLKHFMKVENETTFDFNTIIEMPKTVYTGSLGEEERKKYGENNWYDWGLKNWGTKWNSANTKINNIKETNESHVLKFEFQTAWSTPIPVIDKLVKMYPDFKFHIEFADEDIGSNCGYYHCDDDGASVDFLDDEEFAANVWGYSEELSE